MAKKKNIDKQLLNELEEKQRELKRVKSSGPKRLSELVGRPRKRLARDRNTS